ncbi:hypothetical protein NKH98_32150 [Mesorhizobium sp. M0833]|uniref:hypothetical protein n=1 Tax=Mesorhizobium sp. M0833 TaxID=2957009 RepID=UPI0033368C86
MTDLIKERRDHEIAHLSRFSCADNEMSERLRGQCWMANQIAAEAGVSPGTIIRVLRRLGFKKAGRLGGGTRARL